MTETPTQTNPDRIECKATKDPIVRLFILAAMLIGFGLYCFMTREGTYTAPGKDLNKFLSWAMGEYGPFVCIPPGVLVAMAAFLAARKRLVADAQGIGFAGGEKIAWSAITAVDAGLLQSKGLLFIHATGQAKPLRLCDWKLTDFKPMVAFLEAHLPAGVTVKTK
ncbi:MAG: hypothetical protein NTV86_17270 [Planctomycetota bacterium]|nr:hypothetical protein [Planctomycetota bacterium]